MEQTTGFLIVIAVVLATWLVGTEIILWKLQKEIQKIRQDRTYRKHDVNIKLIDLEGKMKEQKIELEYLRKRIDFRIEAVYGLIKDLTKKE